MKDTTETFITDMVRKATDSSVQSFTHIVNDLKKEIKDEKKERIERNDFLVAKLDEIFRLVEPMTRKMNALDPLRESYEQREKAIRYLGEKGKSVITIAKYIGAIAFIATTAIAVLKIALK